MASLRAAEEANGPTIPLRRVVMFSSGVSFYERTGDIEGNAKVDLLFNVRDVNDLLKSMVLQDLGGGRISTVSYGSKDPITRTLRTFSIDLTTNPTLADLLAQARGEKVEIEAPDKITGVIVGVETRQQPADKEGHAINVSYLTLLTDDGLRSLSFDRIGRIKFASPKLDADFRQALAVLALGKSVDKKTVSLNFLGAGKRGVRVGYIQESPVWKTSYRLVLGEKDPPLMQGWAIVENTTEEDWKDINLTLISGRPISFIMDLYEPLYVDRPEVKPELYASLKPRTYEQDLAGKDAEFRRAGEEANMNALAKKAPAGKFAAPAAPPGTGFAGRQQEEQLKRLADGNGEGGGRMNLREGFQSVAQAADVGEMFQYTIGTPVTVERQRSAMLPIVNESVQGEKLSIYNPGVHAKHPLNGLRLKNTTDLHLMQGPITVFDDGAYAGDAQIADLPPKSERLISYAMDLDTEVAPTSKGLPEELLGAKLVKGTLYLSRKYGRTQSYVVKNSGKKAKKVLIEYPLDSSWTLITPKEASEKTRDMYRFAVAAEPGKPASLDITEQRTADESIHVNNLDDNGIRFYISAKVVSDAVKSALGEIIKKKAALQQVLVKRQDLERQVQVIFQEQERIRQNMAQLPKDSDLFRRYVQKFNDQEDAVEKLRTEVQKSIAEEQAQRKALDDYLLGLNLV